MSLSSGSRISRQEALGPIQMAGCDQGTGLGLCFHRKYSVKLAHGFIRGGLRDEGTLLSKLPCAAVTDRHTAAEMSLALQPLPSNILR